MKREGRQHGMVRAYVAFLSPSIDPLPQKKIINEVTAPPTAGLFTKVSSKPTNHSKYTGKCTRGRCHGCHSQPVCKSMDKVKGAHKVRSTSGAYRVVDGTQGLKFAGFSASGLLSYLDSVDHDDGIDYDDGDADVEASCDSFEEVADGLYSVDHDDGIDYDDGDADVEASCDSFEEVADGFDVVDDDDDDDDGDDVMGFCEVGLVWGPVDGDESWCLVDEI